MSALSLRIRFLSLSHCFFFVFCSIHFSRRERINTSHIWLTRLLLPFIRHSSFILTVLVFSHGKTIVGHSNHYTRFKSLMYSRTYFSVTRHSVSHRQIISIIRIWISWFDWSCPNGNQLQSAIFLLTHNLSRYFMDLRFLSLKIGISMIFSSVSFR